MLTCCNVTMSWYCVFMFLQCYDVPMLGIKNVEMLQCHHSMMLKCYDIGICDTGLCYIMFGMLWCSDVISQFLMQCYDSSMLVMMLSYYDATMEQHVFKNVNNCLNINMYSY